MCFFFGPRVCPGQNALRFWKEISYDEVFRGLVLDPEASFGDDNRLLWCFLPMEISFSNRTLHEDVYGSFGWALLTFVDDVNLAGVFLLEEGNRLAAAFKEMLGLSASQLTWKSQVVPLGNMIKQHVKSITVSTVQ